VGGGAGSDCQTVEATVDLVNSNVLNKLMANACKAARCNILYLFIFIFFSLYQPWSFFIRSPNGAWLLQVTVKFEAFLNFWPFMVKRFETLYNKLTLPGSDVLDKLHVSVSNAARFCFIFFNCRRAI